MDDITTEQFLSLSEKERDFFLWNKDDMELCVVNGKLHYKWYNKPYVKWERFKELLKFQDSLTALEDYYILYFYTDFNDWNHFGRPYADYGFHYTLSITASSANFYKFGIKKNVEEWLTDWLLGNGFRDDEIATISSCGCTRRCNKDGSYSETKTYGIEIRCRFRDIPAQWLPEKVHRWAKRNPKYKHLIFGK